VTSGHRDEGTSPPADPRPLSAAGVLWIYVAWLQYNPHRAIVLTSFLFAVCHFSFTALPWYFFVGFALALLVQQPGSTLLAPMILHIALNARYHMSF
jgi:membrane protease YdiL (CAAX protease family)